MATPSSASRRPAPGDVLVYGYLWSHESETGRDDPIKVRPCVVVLAVGPGEHPDVLVAPITSRAPSRPDAIALAGGMAGLDRPSWIIPWELNLFRWPGPDVAPAPKPVGAWWRMGSLSLELRRQLRTAVEAGLVARRSALVKRPE